MFDNVFDLTDSDFETRVKNVVMKSYPTITDHVRMASVINPGGFAPPTIIQLRERNGNRFLFVWGSTWGGKRPVSG